MLTLLIEIDLIERPIDGTLHLEAHAVVGVFLATLQGNGLVERTGWQLARIPAVLIWIGMGFVTRLLARHAAAFQTAQLHPGRAVVRAFADDGVTTLCLALVESHATAKLHLVGLLSPAALQRELIVGIRTYHRVARIGATIEHPLSLSACHRAVGSCQVEVFGVFLAHNAVGHQLSCQVVVVTRRVERTAQERQVAVGLIGLQVGREILLRVARILANPSGVIVRPLKVLGRSSLLSAAAQESGSCHSSAKSPQLGEMFFAC